MQLCPSCASLVDHRGNRCAHCNASLPSSRLELNPGIQILLIGSHPENDILLDRKGVHPFHFVLWMDKLGSKFCFTPSQSPIFAHQETAHPQNGWHKVQVGAQTIPANIIASTMKYARSGVVVGRSPAASLTTDNQTVSWNHLAIVPAKEDPGSLILIDLGSSNGTYVVSSKSNRRRINWQLITPSDSAVVCGSMPLPDLTHLCGHAGAMGTSHNTGASRIASRFMIAGETCIVGRDQDVDLTLPFPQISRRHLMIRKHGANAYALTDLGSVNGTYVNGRRITQNTTIDWGKEFRIGPIIVRVDQKTGDLLFDKILGSIHLRASNICHQVVIPSGVALTTLHNVSLGGNSGEIVGIMGPSGSGKSTLISLLNGHGKPTSGDISINEVNILDHNDEVRDLIGYVPQDDLIHPQLTVRQMLYFKARLRLPSDLDTTEIDDRISEVIQDLNIADCANTRIGSADKKYISGGQRKRANLASELIADPPILILDEPTSGLSSQDALEIMKVLRTMANQGRIIILSIHQPSPEIYAMMDKTLFLTPGGHQAFFGRTTPDSFDHFGVSHGNTAQILEKIAHQKPESWARKIDANQRNKPQISEASHNTGLTSLRHIRQTHLNQGVSNWQQFKTLTHRTLTIKSADSTNLVFMMLQAPLIGILLSILYAETTKEIARRPEPIFIICIASIFFGAFNAAREFTAERGIFARESVSTIRIAPYVFSKFLPLLALGGFQALILSIFATTFLGFQGSFIFYWFVITISAGAASALGLLISAASRSAEMAMTIVPIVLIFQIVLSGYLRPINNKQMDFVTLMSSTMIGRWSIDALFESERMGLSDGGLTVSEVLQKMDQTVPAGRKEQQGAESISDNLLTGIRDVLSKSDPTMKADELYWQEAVQKGSGFTPYQSAKALGILTLWTTIYLLVASWLLRGQNAR